MINRKQNILNFSGTTCLNKKTTFTSCYAISEPITFAFILHFTLIHFVNVWKIHFSQCIRIYEYLFSFRQTAVNSTAKFLVSPPRPTFKKIVTFSNRHFYLIMTWQMFLISSRKRVVHLKWIRITKRGNKLSILAPYFLPSLHINNNSR